MMLIQNTLNKPARPVRVVQFGTGVFLRGFVDYMIDIVNEKTEFDGSVAVVKSTARGGVDALKEQDCLYTVTLRGLENGAPVVRSRAVTCVSRVVSSNAEYDDYAALAKNSDVRVIVSNTTEAGIVLDEEDAFALCPPRSFPGKVVKFLYERAVHFDYAPDKGVYLLPCELIDDNGSALKNTVMHLAQKWDLGEKFLSWLNESCVFANTLVDRIVTGYPADAEALWQQYGYEDKYIVTAEPYGLWVIAGAEGLEDVLPLKKAGLPVVYADSLAAYRTRKVRILNGAHTSFVPAAYLAGFDIVRDTVKDADFAAFIGKTLQQEIIPTIDLPEAELNAFAGEVLERFANPYIDHKLLAICLNSVSKWKTRILPTVLDNVEVPQRLAFSLAALLTLYKTRTDVVQDDAAALAFILDNDLPAILANDALWGMDLHTIPGFADAVAAWFDRIAAQGVKVCVKELGA